MAVLGTLCWSLSNAIDFKCEFSYYTDFSTNERFAYTCNLREITTDDTTKTNVIGDHQYRDGTNTKKFTNDDVESVEIYVDNIFQIPKGLTKVFPKLSKLLISPKIQGISENDFEELKQLKKLSISVDNIPEHTFDNLELLEEFTLRNSAIELFPSNIFEKMLKLEVVKVNGGVFGKLKQLPANLFKNNLNLKDIQFSKNGLNCIHDGLLDGLNKLEIVSFDNDCIKANYPSMSLSEIKDKIHSQCQTQCEVLVNSIIPEKKPEYDQPLKSEFDSEDFDMESIDWEEFEAEDNEPEDNEAEDNEPEDNEQEDNEPEDNQQNAAFKPRPIRPRPIKPRPIKPKPIKPKPIEPKPIEPKPIKPKPTCSVQYKTLLAAYKRLEAFIEQKNCPKAPVTTSTIDNSNPKSKLELVFKHSHNKK